MLLFMLACEAMIFNESTCSADTAEALAQVAKAIRSVADNILASTKLNKDSEMLEDVENR